MANTIGFDPVPFSVDGGRHPGSLLRLLAYAATSGEKGVVQPDDCKVGPLTTAGPQVTIATGAVVIPVQGSDSQVYVANASGQSIMDIDPTSGAARQDMVVARVFDPEFTSENAPPTPGDAPNWQYVRPWVIKGVPAGTKTFDDLDLPWSATELARIELPPNTTNITQGMIKDLRQIARPRSKVDQQTVTFPPGHLENLTSSSRVSWPATAARDIAVPRWAKRAVVEIMIGGIRVTEGGVWGGVRGRLGVSTSQYSVTTKDISYDANTPVGNNYDRQTMIIADTLTIPDQLRGTTQPFTLEAHRFGVVTPGPDAHFAADEWTSVSTKITFQESIA